MSENSIRLTQCNHGAGCSYKISPKVLETILRGEQTKFVGPNLLVGNETRGGAAVYDLGDGTGVISAADFFMPVADNPFDFDRIATTNAISDIFAVGDKPIMAITILDWSISRLSPEIVREVTEGRHYACHQAGVTLAGGHSTDAPESIFGPAITGTVPTERVKKNNTAQAGCKLFPTKPLGIDVLTTAEKELLLKPEHQELATEVMYRMNVADASFANAEDVGAMTDVTGFGLLGHLNGICQDAGVQTCAGYDAIPKLLGVEGYIKLGATPGGTERNFASCGHLMGKMPHEVRGLLCGSQTSGGLLLAVVPEAENEIKTTAAEFGIELTAIGELVSTRGGHAMVEIR